MKKNKRYLILSSAPDSHSVSRIKEEGEQKGHEMVAASPFDYCIRMDEYGRVFLMSLDASKGGSFDGILPRGLGSEYGYSVLNVMSLYGYPIQNSLEGIKTAANKLDCQIMIGELVTQPRMMTIQGNGFSYSQVIDNVGGLPAVAKPFKGSQGAGINIFNDKLQSSVAFSNLKKSESSVLLQEFITTAKEDEKKCDIRAYVISGVVVAAYKRFSIQGDFRSNYSLSGDGEKVDLTQEEKMMCLKISSKLGLRVCGVDIARDINDTEKPYLIEANSTPGLKGIESVTGVNVAKLIIEDMDSLAQESEDRHKNQVPSASISSFAISKKSDATAEPKESYKDNTPDWVKEHGNYELLLKEKEEDNFKGSTMSYINYKRTELRSRHNIWFRDNKHFMKEIHLYFW